MQRRGLPIFETTAWGMAYGAALSALVATFMGASWTFDARAPYVLSLAYLAVFGSVVAFGAYLTLLKQVGAGPSSYTSVATPVVAMLLSTLFEGYRWSALALARRRARRRRQRAGAAPAGARIALGCAR